MDRVTIVNETTILKQVDGCQRMCMILLRGSPYTEQLLDDEGGFGLIDAPPLEDE